MFRKKKQNKNINVNYKIIVHGTKECLEKCEEMKTATRELREETEQLNASMEKTVELLGRLNLMLM